MHNILRMEYLPAFIRSPCYKSPKPGQPPPLERMGKFFYHGFYGLDGSFPMRGWEQNKNKINLPILRRTALQAAFVVGYLYPRALPPVTHGSAFQAPERMWGPIRGRTETSRGWVGLSMFIALRWMQRPRKGDDVAD